MTELEALARRAINEPYRITLADVQRLAHAILSPPPIVNTAGSTPEVGDAVGAADVVGDLQENFDRNDPRWPVEERERIYKSIARDAIAECRRLQALLSGVTSTP